MIVIVGAGLAGLASATRLQEAGADWILIEGAEGPGGRVVTEVTADGYRLDRGFQVLLDSYPTASCLLDLESLQPRYFQSGALMADVRQREVLLNPLRHPEGWTGALFSKSFTLWEKGVLAAYGALQVLRSDRALLDGESGRSTMEELRRLGLDGGMLEKFLRPFFAGVFLDNDLGTDASVFRYDLKMFALGRALLPAGGIGEITRQLASRLPSTRQFYGNKVVTLERLGSRFSAVSLENGEHMEGESFILATDEPSTRRLLGLPEADNRKWSHVTTLYFTGDHPLYKGALLVLPPGNKRIVRHFVDLTNVAPEYAPVGKRLLSVTVLDDPKGDVVSQARAEIEAIFPSFSEWKFLKEVRIPNALPSQAPGFHGDLMKCRQDQNLWLAGDQVSHASIESALASGLQAADEVLSSL